MRRPSEAQFVVFSLKSFVQDLVRSRIKVFRMAIIAGANQDRDPAVDVSFVAPLPKCHFFHALWHAPLFADFTMTGSFSTAISDPLAVAPNPRQACTTLFEGCVSYFTLRRELTRLQRRRHSRQ